jgi:hypothetical protein
MSVYHALPAMLLHLRLEEVNEVAIVFLLAQTGLESFWIMKLRDDFGFNWQSMALVGIIVGVCLL